MAFDDLDAGRRTRCGGCASRSSWSSRLSPYPDLDGRDLEPGTRHALADDGDELVGVPAPPRRRHARADRSGRGRPVSRGRGLARDLMDAAMAEVGGREVRLDAQTGLTALVRVVRLRGERPGVRRGRRRPRADGAPVDDDPVPAGVHDGTAGDEQLEVGARLERGQRGVEHVEVVDARSCRVHGSCRATSYAVSAPSPTAVEAQREPLVVVGEQLVDPLVRRRRDRAVRGQQREVGQATHLGRASRGSRPAAGRRGPARSRSTA